MTEFKNNLIHKIKAGDIDMKPKWHFMLRSVLIVSSVGLMFLMAVYLLSFILFFLAQSGVGFSLLYGFRGLSIFVISSPWLLLLTAGVFVVALSLLVRQFSWSYSRPGVYTVLMVVVLMLISSLVFDTVQIHERTKRAMQDRPLPVLSSLYQSIDARRDNVTLGVVVSVTEHGLQLETLAGGEVAVQLLDTTRLRPGLQFTVGDSVFVYGPEQNGVIQAIGIRPAKRDMNRVQNATKIQGIH